MRLRDTSLSTKLNLALLVFFLVLGAATLAIVLYGFNRTQDNANQRSREALEEEGKLALQALVGGVSDAGAIQLEYAAAVGQRASRYLQDFKSTGATAQYDVSRFVQTEDGVWYDPDPSRVSALVVPNHVAELEGPILDDIAYSAPLDAILPALAEGFPGQLSGDAYHPFAIIFVGVNGVGRYYPPIGISETTPAELDVSDFYDRFGPVANPKRESSWTPPYEDLQGRGLVITAQTPIYDGDVFRGIFEVDLSIDSLVGQINALKPTEGGFAFYVDKDGQLLRTGAFELLSLAADENSKLAAVLEAMKDPADGTVTVESVTLAGEEFFIAHRHMAPVGGSIAAAAPIDELTAQAAEIAAEIDEEGNRTLLIMLVAMGALFIAGLAAASYLNRRVLVTPIRQLADATRAVAGGDFDTRVSLNRSDEVGALAGSFNIMLDELQARNETLSEREEQYRSVFNATNDGVLLFTVQGELVEVNPSCCEMHGYTREEFLKLPPASFIHGDDLRSFGTFVESVATGGEFRTRARDIRRDGSYFPIEVLGRPFVSGGKQLLMAVIRDITEQVETEQTLERRVEERTRELAALLELSRRVASTLELEPLLQLILAEMCTVLDFNRGTFLLRDGDEFVVRSVLSPTDEFQEDHRREVGMRFPMEPGSLFWEEMVKSHRAITIDDVRDDSPQATAYRAIVGSQIDATTGAFVSWLGVPLTLKGEMTGLLAVSTREPAFFTEEHAHLLQAAADQAAVAIENARLFEEAQQAASLEERQRLARELHDSVSQALYGIALGARTARELIEREPARAAEPIDYVLSLAEAGLTEMRALIFELRPESLEAEGLVVAIQKQVAATQARYAIDVSASLGDEPVAPQAVKEALYRIAQEALHNVVKHAKANHIELRLAPNGTSLELEIKDDGIGFDPDAEYAGHLGLQSMRERAARLNGELTIESTPGKGSRLRARLPFQIGPS